MRTRTAALPWTRYTASLLKYKRPFLRLCFLSSTYHLKIPPLSKLEDMVVMCCRASSPKSMQTYLMFSCARRKYLHLSTRCLTQNPESSSIMELSSSSKQNPVAKCNMSVLVPAFCVKTPSALRHGVQKLATGVVCWVCWHINNTSGPLLLSSTTSLS